MIKKIYHINKMTCGSEESLIRIKISQFKEIKAMYFDLNKRTLTLILTQENKKIDNAIFNLNLSCNIISTKQTSENININENKNQYKILWIVLLINLGFFVIEMTTGLISKSMGLVADSLDMLSDAAVYGLSLWAIGASLNRKILVAKISGYSQMILAVLGLFEVVKRFLFEDTIPNYKVMIIVSIFALIANTISMILLNKTKSKDAHIKASQICTSNDIIINISVVVAGLIVMFTNSLIPDLIIACIVFIIVIRGAIRILKLS